MAHHVNRREFMTASAAVGAGIMIAGKVEAAPFKTKLRKSLIGKPSEETFKAWSAAGFEGMEARLWDITPSEADNHRRVAEKNGIRIHSVLRGWTKFNSPDKGTVAKDIASVETALKAAHGYGADDILLVPCRVGGMPIPKAWEFNIEFDENSGHVGRVVAGDNSMFEKYIEAQNHATDATRKAIKQLIPVAEKMGIVIGVENVWNNLWVKPRLFKNFVESFNSPWVRPYFDIGNHVKYAPAEEWIRTLGQSIIRCHVKDFLLNSNGQGGKFVAIRDGSVNWPAVRRALDEVGYDKWMTIEGSGGLSLEEKSKRLDIILAGK